MPKATSSTFLCSVCLSRFTSSRGLCMHLYHNRTTCGYSVPTHNNETSDDDSSNSGSGNNDKFSNDGIGNDNKNEIETCNDLDYNQPFLLTPSQLEEIPGEMDVVHHSVDQRVHVELLHLLEKVEAPDYLFKEIIDWGSHAQAMNYSFTPWPSSRHANLKDLQDPFNMHNLCPTISELKLESVDARVPIVSFDFKTLLVSLLTDSSLMQPENLVLNKPITRPDGSLDVTPWFLPFKSDGMKVDEVLSGKWFNDTVSSARDPANCFYCPLIMYVDKTFIDPMRCYFNLEPFNFTLAIFKRSCQTQFSFLRTLHPKWDGCCSPFC